MTAHNKLLVLVDGSERGWQTLKYITQVEWLREKDIVLLHVFSEFPEYLRHIGQDDQKHSHVLPDLEAWQKRKRERIEAFMESGKAYHIGEGLADDQIDIRIQNRQKGIVVDILEEAAKGYEAVVLRRRGMGCTMGVMLGSVSCKLLGRLPDEPILLAGTRPPNKKLLVSVDGSPSSCRTVASVADRLGHCDYSAELLHVIRGSDTLDRSHPEFVPEELLDLISKETSRQLECLRDRMVSAGFDSDKVSCQILSGKESRAETIVQEAEKKECGAIVVGRKETSHVQKFWMGRICHKVIHSGRDFTVWIP